MDQHSTGRPGPCLALLVALTLLGIPAVGEAADVRGKIARYDAERNSLLLEGDRPSRGRGAWLQLTPDTAVLWAGRPTMSDALTPGRRVAVTWSDRDGQRIVTRIRITDPAPRPARGAPPGPAPSVTPPAPALPAPALSAPARGPSEVEVVGVLLRVGRTERDVVVLGPGADGPQTETAGRVAADVRVSRDGGPIAYETLKEGEKALVRFVRRAGRREAVVIQIGAPPATTLLPPPQGPAATPSAPSPSPTAPQDRPWVSRARLVLRIVDWGLGQMERR